MRRAQADLPLIKAVLHHGLILPLVQDLVQAAMIIKTTLRIAYLSLQSIDRLFESFLFDRIYTFSSCKKLCRVGNLPIACFIERLIVWSFSNVFKITWLFLSDGQWNEGFWYITVDGWTIRLSMCVLYGPIHSFWHCQPHNQCDALLQRQQPRITAASHV